MPRIRALPPFTGSRQGCRRGGDAWTAGFESCPGGKGRRLARIRMGKDGNRSDPCYRSLFGNLRRREEVRSHFFLAPNHRGLFFDGQPPGWPFAFPPTNPAQPKGFVTRTPPPNGSMALSIFGQSSPPSEPKSGESRPKLSLSLSRSIESRTLRSPAKPEIRHLRLRSVTVFGRRLNDHPPSGSDVFCRQKANGLPSDPEVHAIERLPLFTVPDEALFSARPAILRRTGVGPGLPRPCGRPRRLRRPCWP